MKEAARSLRTVRMVTARELIEHSRTPLVWVLAIVAMLLSVLAAQMGLQRLHIETQRYSQLKQQLAAERSTSASLTGARVEPSLRVLRDPNPFVAIVEGQALSRPQYWDFGPAGVRSGASLALDLPYPISTQALDIEAVIRIVVGLLAVLLAVESIAGERAKGTLLALLGQPVNAGAIASGKLLGGACTLALVIALCAVAAIVTIGLSVDRPDVSVYGSFLAICAAGVGYTVICLAAAMLMSTLLASYRLALTISILVWSVAALVEPSAGLAIARVASPLQVRSVIEGESEALAERSTENAQRLMGEQYAAALGGPGEWAQKQNDASANAGAWETIEPIWSAHLKRLRAQLEKTESAFSASERHQRYLVHALLIGNPAGAFTSAANDLAAVGDASVGRWRATVLEHQKALNLDLFDDRPSIIALAPYVSGRSHEEHRLVVQVSHGPAKKAADMPSFRAPTEDFRQRFGDAGPALLTLAIYTLGSTTLCVIAFKTKEFNLSRSEE